MKKIFTLLVLLTFALNAAPLKIAENGKALAGILIPADAKPVTRLAAEELAAYLKKMTGATFTVGTQSRHKVNFKIGFGNAADFLPNEYVIRTSGNDIEIYGRDSDKKFSWFQLFYLIPWQGSLRGVYEFLDLQGVRWPNPSIEYVPKKSTMTVPDLNIRRKIKFVYINDAHSWDFVRSQKDGREYVKNTDDVFKWLLRIGFFSDRYHVYGCHTEHHLGLYKDPQWVSDPTRLMQGKDGRRNARYSCWTHPDLAKIWIKAADGYFSGKSTTEAGFKYIEGKPPKGISHWPYPFVMPNEFMVDPMDITTNCDGRCYCKRCQEYRRKHPCADDTEIIWNVIIQVAEYVQKKFPGKYISTLVYPPKHQLPKRKLPPNIRVRICLAGAKIGYATPKFFKEDVNMITAWKNLTGNRPPLWTYHWVSFGNAMPYLVETYPREIARYIKTLRSLISGEYMEIRTWNRCFTPVNLDIYIHRRMMNNPDRDVESELKDYFKASYGPAAAEGEKFFNELERLFKVFWDKGLAKKKKPDFVTAWNPGDADAQRSLWDLAYTAEKMRELDGLVKVMEKKTSGTIYARQVYLLRKYLLDEIISARKKIFANEEQRRTLAVRVTACKAAPSPADWEKAPRFQLRQADRFSKTAVVPGEFRLLSDGRSIYCRAELTEPALDKTKSVQRRNGAKDIWKDNSFELFFYSAADRKLNQIIINDAGFWSSNYSRRGQIRWKLLPGIKISVKRGSNSWTAEITIPVSSVLPKEGGELRFNAVRERNIKGIQPEFSTWSPLSLLGEWRNYNTFPTLNLQ